jgi:hypothetical protein
MWRRSAEQRLMLQSLLRDRFAFEAHFETNLAMFTFSLAAKKPLPSGPPKIRTPIRERL